MQKPINPHLWHPAKVRSINVLNNNNKIIIIISAAVVLFLIFFLLRVVLCVSAEFYHVSILIFRLPRDQ